MKLNKFDLERALRILPEEVKALLISNGKSLVVAGGYLRSIVLKERIKDIDLFPSTKESGKLWAEGLNNTVNGKYNSLGGPLSSIYSIIVTENAYSVKNVRGHFVQFIHRWVYPTPEELIASFDFTISQAAFWFDSLTGLWDSVVGETFYADCAAKRLVFTNPTREEEPAGSMLRVLKFSKKGYTIDSRSLAQVITKLVNGSVVGSESPYYKETLEASVYSSIYHLTGES